MYKLILNLVDKFWRNGLEDLKTEFPTQQALFVCSGIPMQSKEQEFAAEFDGNLENFHARLKANNSPLMRFSRPATRLSTGDAWPAMNSGPFSM